ncbi:MAG: ABC transporter permease [Deltaproteobacteria bacterium]|nr:ABC transporter permease [Deltaproteobacteria bacterium]
MTSSTSRPLTPRKVPRFRRFAVRTGAMARKETWHVVRDPSNLFLALGMPVVLIIVFGYGVSFDLDHVPVAIIDQDGTRTSRQVARDLTASGEFDAIADAGEPEDADRLFRRQEAAAAVILPRGMEKSLARGEQVTLQVLVDGSDGGRASSVIGSSAAIVRSASIRAAASGLPRAMVVPIRGRVRTLFNPELRSAVFLVPGLIAYVLAIAAVLLTALTVAREWERGNMEQLFATPVGRLEIVLGKLSPYLAIGLLQALLVLAVGTVVFDVPVRGHMALLAAGTLLFLAGTLSQGLFISVLARNQQVATQAGAISSLLPAVLLSGFLFPIENMPLALQVIASVFPSRYYVELLRGVMLKDAPLAVLWPQLAAMAAFAAVMIVLSTARFGRRIA